MCACIRPLKPVDYVCLASSERAHGQQSMHTLRPSMDLRTSGLVSSPPHVCVIIQALVHGCGNKLASTSL